MNTNTDRIQEYSKQVLKKNQPFNGYCRDGFFVVWERDGFDTSIMFAIPQRGSLSLCGDKTLGFLTCNSIIIPTDTPSTVPLEYADVRLPTSDELDQLEDDFENSQKKISYWNSSCEYTQSRDDALQRTRGWIL